MEVIRHAATVAHSAHQVAWVKAAVESVCAQVVAARAAAATPQPHQHDWVREDDRIIAEPPKAMMSMFKWVPAMIGQAIEDPEPVVRREGEAAALRQALSRAGSVGEVAEVVKEHLVPMTERLFNEVSALAAGEVVPHTHEFGVGPDAVQSLNFPFSVAIGLPVPQGSPSLPERAGSADKPVGLLVALDGDTGPAMPKDLRSLVCGMPANPGLLWCWETTKGLSVAISHTPMPEHCHYLRSGIRSAPAGQDGHLSCTFVRSGNLSVGAHHVPVSGPSPEQICKERQAQLWCKTTEAAVTAAPRCGSCFRNPVEWDTWVDLSASRVLKYVMTKRTPDPPGAEVMASLTGTARYHDPDGRLLEAAQDRISLVWLGHAACLLRINGITVLTDPVFTEKPSPTTLVGPRRLQPLCLEHGVDSLPNIDIVLISHDHHDHCSKDTLKAVVDMHLARKRTPPLFLAGLGLDTWLSKKLTSAEHECRVVGLDWYARHEIRMGEGRSLCVTFTPAQHWGGRYQIDKDERLWGSFALEAPEGRGKVFFAGDTGYCPEFKHIGAKFGGFDLALIPIGACSPREVMKYQHVDAYDAAQLHIDLKAKRSVAIHWGTWILSNEPVHYPKNSLEEAKTAMAAESFTCENLGAVLVIDT